LKRIVLALALAGLGSPVAAHAFLVKAHPAAAEKLHAGPAKIELHFSEALEPTFSGVTVTNAAAAEMSAGPAAASGTEMDLPLKALKPGRYRVRWHVVSVDGHRTEGKYDFLVLP
jgi:methionine-rich copper-binding protein CopC